MEKRVRVSRVSVPFYIAEKNVLMDVEVVHNDIPLLISKQAMTELDMVFDFSRNEVCIKKKVIKLESNSSGHYVIPVYHWTHEYVKWYFI